MQILTISSYIQLLEKDHTKRIGSQYSPAGDIVEHIFFRPIDWNLLEKRQIEPPFRPQVVSFSLPKTFL